MHARTNILLQVFLGGTTNWQPHFNALTVVVNKMPAEAIVEGQDGIEHATRFLMANVIWFDIIACTSTNSPPRIAYKEYLSRDIDLCPIMGCQNWVMIAIGDIANLDAQRLVWDIDEVPREVLEIQERLEIGIDEMNNASEVSISKFQVIH